MQTVCVVTPVYNGADFIDRSIQHVVSQSGNFKIRYHVQDGGSTDGTVEKLAAWQARLAEDDALLFCDGVEFSYASDTDKSMYEALTKGFAVLHDAPPDAFMTWINHDDLLLPGACALAAGLTRQFDKDDVAWFTGMHNATWHDGNPIPLKAFPLPQSFIAQGVADARLMACIQQEGTFFRKWLWDAVDKAEAFDGLRRAGDWNLWRLMAQHAKLFQVEWMQTGRFTHREGQLTDGFTAYLDEVDGVVDREARISRFIELVNSDDLVTPVVFYNTDNKKYETRDRATTKYKMLEQAAWQVQEIRPCFDEAIEEAQTAAAHQAASPDMDVSVADIRRSLERLARFELMSPKGLKRVVDSDADTTTNWRNALLAAPHQYNKWLALRRATRRSRRSRK